MLNFVIPKDFFYFFVNAGRKKGMYDPSYTLKWILHTCALTSHA